MEKNIKGWKPLRCAAAAILALGLIVSAAVPMTAVASDSTLQLLKPQTDTQPLLQLLSKRVSSRAYRAQPLPLQTLSNLLWSAFGISRPESGMRTAPTANNKQEIDVYVAMEQGIYLYDAKANLLKLIVPGDHRGATGVQSYVKDAALNLVYVADYDKSGAKPDEDKLLYAAATTGFISENVYLYCASAGLGAVIRASVDRPALAEIMKLRPNQKIILAQTVGYLK
jgi:SagB-type dehydrogenase family enzyme